MPYKEHDITKQWYSIGEVAEILNVFPSAIRFWSDEYSFLIKGVRRNRKGNRTYTPQQIKAFEQIKAFTESSKEEKLNAFVLNRKIEAYELMMR